MNKRDKQRAVFVKLINKQLEPHGVVYEDVVSNQEWYMQYNTTEEEEASFIQWGTDLISKELKLNKHLAEQEMSWFILQWGLTTSNNEFNQNKTEKVEKIKVKRKN